MISVRTSLLVIPAFISLSLWQPVLGSELKVVVKEKGSGKPIVDARVSLQKVLKEMDWELVAQHDCDESNGATCCVFKDLPKGTYFLQCEAKGYASEPSIFVMNAKRETVFRSKQAILDALKAFSLGKNEFLKMELILEPGGAIKGLLRHVGCAGTSILPHRFLELCMHFGSRDPFFFEGDVRGDVLLSDMDGKFEIEGLKASDNYFLRVISQGFLPVVVEGVRVKSGRTTRMNADISSSREPEPSGGINSIALSRDGKWLVWGGPYSLYVAKTSEFPRYREFPLDRFEFATEGLAFRGDGKYLFAIGRKAVYRAVFSNGEPRVDACFTNDGQILDHLSVNHDGSRAWTSIDSPDVDGVQTGWRALIQLDDVKGKFQISRFITPAKLRYIIDWFLIDRSDRVYYSYEGDSSVKDKLFRLSPDGKEEILSPGFSGLSVVDVASTGDLLLFGGTVDAKDRQGRPLYTLFVSELTNGVVGKPQPILLPHQDPVLWGAGFGPDGRSIFWTHLVRGNDGNTIVRTEIRVCRYKDGHWEPQEILFTLPNSIQSDLVLSRSNLVVFNTENEIFFYPSLHEGQKPIYLKANIKPYIRYEQGVHPDKSEIIKERN